MPLPQGRNYGVLSGNVKFHKGDYYLTSTDTVAANAAGTQAAGTPLDAQVNVVTSASSGYSVRLPPANPGMNITVLLSTASTTCVVFPSTGETINAIAADSGITMAARTSAVFSCVTGGAWFTTPRVPS